jgi:GH25 family lysozyme M1 (1,4-beta-N-acetylmuramidase)
MTVIDISHYQGNINWDTVANTRKAGLVDGVIMKATDGIIVDPTLHTNQSAARALSVPIGYYHFARPGLTTGAKQAQFLADTVGPLQTGESVWLDLEDTPARPVVGGDVGWAAEWLTTATDAAGTTAGIYLDSSLLHRFNWAFIANKGYPLWLANYGFNTGRPGPSPSSGVWPKWALWQYTSVGHVAGIQPVDVSILADGKFTDLGKKGPTTMPATPGTWSLHDLADTLDVVDSLYIAAGGPTPPPDRYGWAANITDTLSRGEDPAGSLGFIWWALRNPDAAKQP